MIRNSVIIFVVLFCGSYHAQSEKLLSDSTLTEEELIKVLRDNYRIEFHNAKIYERLINKNRKGLYYIRYNIGKTPYNEGYLYYLESSTKVKFFRLNKRKRVRKIRKLLANDFNSPKEKAELHVKSQKIYHNYNL